MRKSALASLVVCVFGCGPDGSRNGNGEVDGGSQPDTGSGGGGGGGGDVTYVYAHTSSTLYRVDPDTLSLQVIGPFKWGSVGNDMMTDIAIDKAGIMIGVSFDRVYRVDTTNAQTTLLSASLDGTFNGLSFVPADMLGQTGDDVLVGTRNTDGVVFRIDPMTGAATEVGNMGAYSSSGDLVAVAGFGTVQTALGSSGDQLVRLAPQTFAASPIGGGTGYSQIWGVAYWKNRIFGFTNGGEFVVIDPSTGVATTAQSTPGIAWWGAAVSTLAPVLQ